ncbi:uncharacterized protein LOC122402049 isoform X2 [Colletes gigas]|uniref:uncharacterized protein LOC122402049 isoform X2 n=1 Tax=Colletes gigas TaxID=935657 RepID=UPI001C9ADC78|nr:uncharacterized protein LOC122402049 isoform X2 [Colletes gigas]
MEESIDMFAWAHKLECPPTLYNDLGKKILCKGLIGFLWDDLADVIFTCHETKIIRKNVLLHQLKQGTPDRGIQCIQNISQMKSIKNDLKNQISKLEEECEQLDFTVRQRVQKLRDISTEHSQIKVKRYLLRMKYDQTNTQLCDCNKMRLVCQHLMPSTCTNLDPKLITEMLDIVTSLWTGANKRQVWDTISHNLDNIEVPTLWHHLHQNLIETVDPLIVSENAESLDTDEKNINTASNNFMDTSEWLVLSLEVCKLETEQRCLQEELDKIRKDLNENNTLTFDLSELTSEIQDINDQIVEYLQNIQLSLNLLKFSTVHLMETKKKICLELQNIIALRNGGYEYTWLNDDLSTELNTFYNTLNLNALRKILLKGNIGVYRYTKSCFNEASLPINNSQASNIKCYFPMIQIPIYSLIECYKNLILQFVYKKFESLKVEENSDIFQMPILMNDENKSLIVKLFNLSKAVSIRTKTEIDEFNEILNAWMRQTVQKVMEIIEKTVDDASFPDWSDRYNLLLYMLQNPTQR